MSLPYPRVCEKTTDAGAIRHAMYFEDVKTSYASHRWENRNEKSHQGKASPALRNSPAELSVGVLTRRRAEGRGGGEGGGSIREAVGRECDSISATAEVRKMRKEHGTYRSSHGARYAYQTLKLDA